MVGFNNIILYSQGITKSQVYTENLDSYVGAWEYKSSNEIFRIVLKMAVDETVLNSAPCLIGDYFYSKSGFVMDNYNEAEIPTSYSEINENLIIIFATNAKIKINWVSPNNLYVLFSDKRTKTLTGKGNIELISPTQIHWTLKGEEGVYDNEDSFKGFSVPTDVIMNKK